MRALLTMTGLLLLGACQTLPEPPAAWEAAVPGTTVFRLERAVTIPPYTAHVTFQGGRVVSDVEKDFYLPHCQLYVRGPEDVAQRVEPDRFTVTGIGTEVDSVRARPLRLAAAGVMVSGGATADDYITILRLHSPRQPRVSHLECHHWEDPTLFPRHLRLDEINQALGEYGILSPPAR